MISAIIVFRLLKGVAKGDIVLYRELIPPFIQLNPVDAKTLQETTTRYDAFGRSTASTVWLQPLGLVDVSNPPIAGLGGIAGTQGLTARFSVFGVQFSESRRYIRHR